MNPDKLQERWLVKGKEKARTNAYYALKDRYRKQVRAKWAVHHMGKETAAKSAQLALIESEYIDACRECEAAELEQGYAAVEYEAAKAWWESWRTLEATKRAEMNLR